MKQKFQYDETGVKLECVKKDNNFCRGEVWAHPKISGAKFEHRDAETRRNNLEK